MLTFYSDARHRRGSDLIGSTLCRRIAILLQFDDQRDERVSCRSRVCSCCKRLCKMAVFSQSRNMTEGKFMKPPDKPKPDHPKLPSLQLKEPSPFQYETNEIEFPPWLQPSRASKVVKSSNKKSAVSFVVSKRTRKKRRRRGTLYDAVAGMDDPASLKTFADPDRPHVSTRLYQKAPRLTLSRYRVVWRRASYSPGGSSHPSTPLPEQ